MMNEFPTGTITFLLTDLEGSTELWERYPDEMRSALARHDEIIEGTVKGHQGVVNRPRGEGDSRFAVFTRAEDGARAAVEIQQRLASDFPDLPFPLKARIGIHTGTADLRMGDYYGSTVNRCARIRNLGHGGQILLSQIAAELVRDDLPVGVSLVDMGTHPLKGLSRGEKIYQLWIPGLPNQFPPLKSPGAILTNLPSPQTNFVGRQRELTEVVDLLLRKEVRLVTLTGMGGTGKTRLSLEVGKALLEHFPQGVFFVDLAPIDNPDLVGTTIARSIGIREGGGRPPMENLKEYLADDKEMLLIFDNFEQILDAAPVVAELLAAAPLVKVLATSRIALRLRGEHEVPITPMALPRDGEPRSIEEIIETEAVKLFVQQAKTVQPGFELGQENVSSVVEICRRLDGLPLAIEIAAARIKMLPPQAILKRLNKSLQLLVGGAVDMPARHQNLRSAIDWSYNLLTADDQNLLTCLGVFVGGFSLESAESVCSQSGIPDVFAGVEALFNASLLRQVESVTGEPRFDMLQTIREYALEKLEATSRLSELRRAHAIHYAGKSWELGFTTDLRNSVWLWHIEEEHDNFRAALSWGMEADIDLSLVTHICSAIFWFWYRFGHFHEGRDWSERAMAMTQKMGDSPLHAMALFVAGMMAMWEGDLHIAAERMEAAIQIVERSGADQLLPPVKMGYGIIQINRGQYREAYSDLMQAAELFDEAHNNILKATTLVHLSNAALGLGEFEAANARLDEAMPIIAEIGDPWQIAFCLNNYGEVARAQGDYEKARGLFQESLVKFRILGNRRGIAECLAGLASVDAKQGQCA